MTRSPLSSLRRRGVTLIELLVVISIMLLVAVVGLPAVRPAMEGRKMRETARAINVFAGSVRNRAIETGRPCGMLIRRMQIIQGATSQQNTEHSQSGIAIEQVEIPPPYAGEFAETTVRLEDWTRNTTRGADYYLKKGISDPNALCPIILKVKVELDGLADRMVRYGDLMQLGGQGPWFTIIRDEMDTEANPYGCGRNTDFPEVDGYIQFTAGTDTNTDDWVDNYWLTLRLDRRQLSRTPWPTSDPTDSDPRINAYDTALWSRPVRFTILSQPAIQNGSFVAARSLVRPLQMPRDVVIDLEASGLDETGASADCFTAVDQVTSVPDIQDPSPVIIIFSPSGAVQGIMSSRLSQLGNTPITQPVYPIHLLLGRWDRMGTLGHEDGLKNWQDLGNFWITINPKSGLIAVAPVHADSASIDPVTSTLRPTTLYESRSLARQTQINSGGR